jgi:lipopolysaccharide transport system ATP-binding protein
MQNVALEVDHVFKKFKKGELYDSLRDLVPALARKFIKRNGKENLQEREFWALRDVCFQVGRGEAFGIIGSNGAGKSTMLKLLCGIMKPSKGKIDVKGRLSALIEVGAGFHPDLTGRENVFLNGAILGMSRADVQRRFDEIVAFSGLEDFIDTPVKRYSSGMFARLGFSVAAHVEPDILVVDEVLSVGDYPFQKRCMERMAQVIHGGATVMFVSHNLRAVAELCTRTLLLDRGEVLNIGPTADVLRRYMEGARDQRNRDKGRELFIADVRTRGVNGPGHHFQSGERAYIDVKLSSRNKFEQLTVVVALMNSEFAEVFATTTEMLSGQTFSMFEGQDLTCTFSLDLHLVPETYHLDIWILREDIHIEYDCWRCAASFFVSGNQDIKWIANLYPTFSIGEGDDYELSRAILTYPAL